MGGEFGFLVYIRGLHQQENIVWLETFKDQVI